MTQSEMKAISLFSGMGGDTLGIQQAGVNVVGFNEIKKKIIETHEKNFGNCKFIGGNITDINKIPDELAWFWRSLLHGRRWCT
mgnify:CR=1 FL=1